MTKLDQTIRAALQELQNLQPSAFDLAKYIQEFRPSAQGKARDVLVQMQDKNFPFSGRCPVLVSIGGGDGEEVDYLLRNTDAKRAILVEMGRPLAALARERNTSLPQGKEIEVFEGDAKEKVVEAISFAHEALTTTNSDYVAITCHAVIHELFDRGKDEFDPLAFFASLFSDDNVATWFSYREPGVPEKWPPTVLLAADCSPKSLLELALAICNQHPTLRDLSPNPLVVGDRVRLHSTLAFEVLCKLFYLPDLRHEIEERSTAVDHRTLTNNLWLAIGETAKKENRANIISVSAPTTSFVSLWQSFGVSVMGLDEQNATFGLAIAESQTRLIAWRVSGSTKETTSDVSERLSVPTGLETHENSAISVANEALDKGDPELLTALLVSKGRAWIESAEKESAIGLLRAVRTRLPVERPAHLWSHYLLSIASLFSGETVAPEMFSEKLELLAGQAGMGLLFRAERMEFCRKVDQVDSAVTIANTVLPVLNQGARPSNSLGSYVLGTCRFLVGSLLRYGGLYANAWDLIDGAQKTFLSGIDSHDTELAHCYYAKAVCVAMTGVSNFDTPFDLRSEGTQQFAGALIQLSYSHAAWFLGDVARSKQYAVSAASLFESIGTPRYAARANRLATLLELWDAMQARREPRRDIQGSPEGLAVRTLTGDAEALNSVASLLASLRPSKALGLLQFAKEFSPHWEREIEIPLPRTLEARSDQSLAWHVPITVRSLKEADAELRTSLSIPIARRLPLLAD